MAHVKVLRTRLDPIDGIVDLLVTMVESCVVKADNIFSCQPLFSVRFRFIVHPLYLVAAEAIKSLLSCFVVW